MPTAKLTKRTVDAAAPADKPYLLYDDALVGFAVRVMPSGAKTWQIEYRPGGGRGVAKKRMSLGSVHVLPLDKARAEAANVLARVRLGDDPATERTDQRASPTVADLCDRYVKDELPKRRPNTARGYRLAIDKDIRPLLGKVKVADLTHGDVDRLHRRVTDRGKPIQANRVVATFSKMLSLAVKWGMRQDNPARGIERNSETRRERFLSAAEIAALSAALDAHEDQTFANIIRIALLTGARRGEVQSMKWADLDLEAGVWVKPAATTKQKKVHRVPLSPPVVQMLSGIWAEVESSRVERRRAGGIRRDAADEFVFTFAGEPWRRDMRKAWSRLLRAAGIDDAHMHDLRHTYASLLVSSGLSLPIIGALLGHTQAQTTMRYSHLMDDPLRAATDRVAALVSNGSAGTVLPLDRRPAK